MTLPDWLEPLPDAAQQRALDAWAIEELGIPGIELMERCPMPPLGHFSLIRFAKREVAHACSGDPRGDLRALGR